MSEFKFCLEAAALHDEDSSALTDAIERYVGAGMPMRRAQMAAIADVVADLHAEREQIHAAVREQHPQVSQAPAVAKPIVREAGRADEAARDPIGEVRPGLERDGVLEEQGALFKRGEPQAGPDAKLTQISEHVSTLTRDWLRKPDIHVLGSMDEAPEPVRRVMQQQDSQGALGTVEGFHWRGGVYLVGDALHSPADVQRVLFHESLGHFGLRGVFGESLRPILDEVSGAMPVEVRRKALQYGLDYTDPQQRRIASEEVLAELAQTRPELSVVQRAVAAIRTWLRAHGIVDSKMTQDEIIANYIMPARGWVERGRSAMPTSVTRPAAMELNAARHSDPDLPQFSRSEEERNPHPFYSGLARGVEGIAAKAQGADGWRAQVDGLVNKGLVKRDEVEWSGLNEWLRAQDGKVTKQQVLDYLAHNGVQVQEVTKGAAPSMDQVRKRYMQAMVREGAKPSDADQIFREMQAFAEDRPHDEALKDRGFDMVVRDGQNTGNEIHDAGQAGETKYGQYTLPGGKNYREILLTLPVKSTVDRSMLMHEGEQVLSESDIDPQHTYNSSHWGEPNILAHIRLNDRTDADGKRVLFVEELQSDWAQEGRKKGFQEPVADLGDRLAVRPARAGSGYEAFVDGAFTARGATEQQARERAIETQGRLENNFKVPRAPFVESTDKWLPLALKRIVKMAADEGYDRVAFVNGEQSADRYDLSKQISRIRFEDNHALGVGPANLEGPHEGGLFTAYDLDGKKVIDRYVQDANKELPDLVGKEAASKLLQQRGRSERGGGGNESRVKELKGLDLKVGGDGMKAFYDKIVPAAVNKLLPRLGGGKLGDVSITADRQGWHITPPEQTSSGKWMVKSSDYNSKGLHFDTEQEAKAVLAQKQEKLQQPGFDVTPQMRERTAEGVPMFFRTGTTAATAGMPPTAPTRGWERAKSVLSDLIDEGLSRSGVYRMASPMSEGSVRARMVAQNFANAERLARDQWGRISGLLEKHFTPEERKQMWEAADEQNTLMQKGQDTAGRGLERLSPEQRDAVEQLHTYGEELLRRAKNAGMFQGEGLPYWTPRMMVMLDEHGELTKPTEPGKKATSGGEGRNVFTTSGNLKQRKYLSVEETEAAMKAKGGELVRDIMTMPLAMDRLERAIAGRELINQIKDLGASTGEPTVLDGRPDHEGFFTLDHPSFTTFRPRFERDADTGKMKALQDQNGKVVFDRVPLYMSKEFEGPVKAILSNTDGNIYKALMLLKSKAMSAIMFSPLIHNMVIFGRALGYDPTIAGTVGLYFKGHAARQDNALMRTAIEGGMVPMGYHGNGMLDITDVARGVGKEGGLLDPRESWIAHGARAIVGAVNKDAGAAAKRFVDKAGDLWHGTLLWNRVADLQMGIFAHAYERLQEKGFEPGVAKVMAAHWANRYAGAIARENMGPWARKAANVLLFSRSFNMGNLGTVKDLAFGMPSGLRAKIEGEYGKAAASQAFTEARRKAWAGFVADAAMSLIALSLAQSVVDRFKKDKSWDDIFGGYMDRASRMWENIKAHPVNPTAYSPWQLSPTHDNEPGKQDRVDMGEIPDQGGRHEYMRLPTGKVVEDLFNWTSHPAQTFANKMSPLARGAMQWIANDKGFGVPVYDPNGSVAQAAVDVAAHLAKSETPWDTIVTAWDKLHGKTTAVENDKLVGNMTGFSYSQGHPQGPDAGVAAEVEQRVKAQKMLAMEDVKRLLRYGQDDLAREKLEGIGLSPREVTQILKHIEQPGDGMTRNQQKRFNQHSNEEDQRRMDNVTR